VSRYRYRRWLAALPLATAASLAAWRRGALSPSGAVGAAAVGTAVFGAGGPRASALLLIFFGGSTVLSRSARLGAQGAQGARARAGGPRRTLAQVLANGGVPAALAMAGACGDSPRVMAAYAGALAAANADTWATELGRRSSIAPRMVTNGRPAPPGVSGAVTPLGTAASLAGAGLLGVACAALYRLRARDGIRYALGIAAAGAAGSLVDSLLGATLQAVYVCRLCAERTEDRAHRHGADPPALTLVRGLPVMTNDTVNLCASLSGAILAATLDVRHE